MAVKKKENLFAALVLFLGGKKWPYNTVGEIAMRDKPIGSVEFMAEMAHDFQPRSVYFL